MAIICYFLLFSLFYGHSVCVLFVFSLVRAAWGEGKVRFQTFSFCSLLASDSYLTTACVLSYFCFFGDVHLVVRRTFFCFRVVFFYPSYTILSVSHIMPTSSLHHFITSFININIKSECGKREAHISFGS